MSRTVNNTLVLGTSSSAVPIIEAVKDSGAFVLTVGATAADPGVAVGHQHIPCDYSDIPALMNKILSLDFSHVVPTCNDASYTAALVLASSRGLAFQDDSNLTDAWLNKTSFGHLASSAGLSTPRTISISSTATMAEVHSAAIHIGFPIMIKPDAQHSGIGAGVALSSQDLAARFTSATLTADSNVVIQQFVQGSLHSVSCFIYKHQIAHEFFVDEFCPDDSWAVELSNYPSRLSTEVREEVLVELSRFVDRNQVSDGLLHTQFIIDHNRPFFLEVMRRCPGDHYGDLILNATGFPYYNAFVSGFGIRSAGKQHSPETNLHWVRVTHSKHTKRVLKPFIPGSARASKYFPHHAPVRLTGENHSSKKGILLLGFESLDQSSRYVDQWIRESHDSINGGE